MTEDEVVNQSSVFLSAVLLGVGLAIAFDVLRIFRKALSEKSRVLTNVCDAVFWSISTVSFLWWLFLVNDGALRFYELGACVLGAGGYFLVISRFFVHLGVFVVKGIGKILGAVFRILWCPVRFFLKKSRRIAVFVCAPLKKADKKLAAFRRRNRLKAKFRRSRAKKI